MEYFSGTQTEPVSKTSVKGVRKPTTARDMTRQGAWRAQTSQHSITANKQTTFRNRTEPICTHLKKNSDVKDKPGTRSWVQIHGRTHSVCIEEHIRSNTFLQLQWHINTSRDFQFNLRNTRTNESRTEGRKTQLQVRSGAGTETETSWSGENRQAVKRVKTTFCSVHLVLSAFACQASSTAWRQ